MIFKRFVHMRGKLPLVSLVVFAHFSPKIAFAGRFIDDLDNTSVGGGGILFVTWAALALGWVGGRKWATLIYVPALIGFLPVTTLLWMVKGAWPWKSFESFLTAIMVSYFVGWALIRFTSKMEKPGEEGMENHQGLSTNTIKIDWLLYKEAVGTNHEYYLEYFKPLLHNKTLFSKCNWSAFIFGPGWALYRKMYAVAFAYSLISAILGVITNVKIAIGLQLCLSVVYALHANVLYFKRVTNKIKLLSYDLTGDELLHRLRQSGGVNKWVPYVVAGCVTSGIIAAITIPQLVKNKQLSDLNRVDVENTSKNNENVTLTPVKNERYAGLPDDAMTMYGSERSEVLGTYSNDVEVVSHGWNIMFKTDDCELEWQVTMKIKDEERPLPGGWVRVLNIVGVEYSLQDQNQFEAVNYQLNTNNYKETTSSDNHDGITVDYGKTVTYRQTEHLTYEQAARIRSGKCTVKLGS